MSNLTQVTRPFQEGGGANMPLLRTEFGKTVTQAVTTSPGAATQVFTSTCDRAVRIWAIGCPIIYIIGGSGIAAPSAADGYVGQDRYVETWMAEAENYIRLAATVGSGTVKIELLK